MKAKNLWRVCLMSLAAVLVLSVLSCGGDDLETDPPTPPVLPTENTGEVNFSINIEGGGGTGSGTATDPAIAQSGDTLGVAITQKSSYTDPNGKVFTCEPKATIKLFTAADTLYVKDLKTLLDVKESSNSQSTKTPAANMQTLQRVQKFSVGGKEITFDLAHDIYTYVNSQSRKIEMPYIKVNPAKYGAAKTEETRAAAVAVTGIRLKRLASPMQTRASTITDSAAYDVNVSFTLDIESVNAKNTNSQTLSFEANFVSVVETTTEVPDPTMNFKYELSHKSGTNSGSSPYEVILGKPLSLEWQQDASYQYFSIANKTSMVIKFEPKAYVRINTAKVDTIWATDVSELQKSTVTKPTINSTGDNPVENTGSQVYTFAGQEVSLNWGYQSYNPMKIEDVDVNLPYLSLSTPEMADMSVTEVPNGVLKGKKGKLYTISVTFKQTLSTVNVSEPQSEQLQYVVKYIGAIAEEEPKPAELVNIKYRKGYQWFEPHDNIPLTYQYIVYKDSIFSDGTVHTSESRSGLTTMEWELTNASKHGNYNQTIEEVLSDNGTKVKVYYFAKQTDSYDAAYRSIKSSRKVAVPDLSTVTYKERTPEIRNPDQWNSYPGWNPSAPKVGWYWADFYYKNRVIVYYSEEKGELLTLFNICSRWYNKILYVEDSINGGKLITFLGDESDIDDIDYRPKFDFNIHEESATMPTGEPAKVFTHTCTTTFLGRQFHYELVDTVYQYTTPPFEGEVTN